MLRNILKLFAPMVFSLPVVLFATTATAGPLTIEVDEQPGKSVVKVVDTDGKIMEPIITSSRRGLMLTFQEETLEPTRIRSTGKRLEYVQAAQYGNRSVIRLAQRPNLRGGIKANTTITQGDGAIELVVVESTAPPPKKPEPLPAADTNALNAKLGPAPGEANRPAIADSAEDDGDELVIDGEDTPPAVLSEAETKAGQADANADADAWPAAADTPSGDLSSGEPRDGATDRSTLWTVAGVSTVAIACVPILLWLRRRNGLPWASEQRLEVLAKTSLGSKQHVICIRVDTRELLIGVTEHQVRLLADLSAPQAASQPTNTIDQAAAPAPGSNQVAAAQRLDAFKSKLAGALATQGTEAPQTSWSDKSSGVIELEKILSRRQGDEPGATSDPNWANEREVG